MRINIYQIDSDKDNNRVKFDSYRRTLENGGINPAIYKCVFHGDVDGDLEDVYTLFNGCDHPGTYQGHSLSVSDIVEVIGDSEDIESGSYFVDSIGFEKLPDFDSTECAEMDGLRMLMIQPHRTPIVTYVKDDLAALQRAVSDHCEESFIEYTYPFEDDCMILGNEEAKLNGIMPIYAYNITGSTFNIALIVLSALAVIGTSVLIGWVLSKVMASKGMVSKPIFNLIASGAIGLCLFLRFGLSIELIQGLFLFFVLLYASMSDLTTHTVDDFVWITVFALAISSIPTIGLTSMLVGGLFVFIPQIALALIPPHKTLGGADIKLSTALAFLLGTWRGIGAYMVGLILAVVIISIYHRRKNSNTKQPFALVPFLSIGAMILFFV